MQDNLYWKPMILLIFVNAIIFTSHISCSSLVFSSTWSDLETYLITDSEEEINTQSVLDSITRTKRTMSIPPEMSISLKFATGDLVRREELGQGQVITFPSDFTEIRIHCDSSYPTRWSFSNTLEGDIKDWYIDKARSVTGDSPSDISTFKFKSELVMLFSSMKTLNHTFKCKLASRNTSSEYLSSNVQLVSNRSHLSVTCLNGQHSQIMGLQRYGKNVNCSLKLHVDHENKKFGCSLTDNTTTGVLSSKIVSCNDKDECGSMVQENTRCMDSIVPNCELNDCTSIKDRWHSGIFVCEFEGTSAYNSMAVSFYFTLKEPKRMFLNKEQVKVNEMLTLEVVNKTRTVYSEAVSSSLWFNCSASTASFSSGLFWALQYENDLMHYFPSVSNDSYYVETSQAYSTLQEIHFSANMAQTVRVYCLGPKWNSYNWENVSVEIFYEMGKPHLPNPEDNNATTEPNTKTFWTEQILTVTSTLLVVILILILVIFILYRRWKKSSNLEALTQEDIDAFLNGNMDRQDPLFYPYNTEYEIPRAQFQIESKLGDGQFGCVRKGKLGRAPVAIKTVKKNADISHLKSLLSELKIMSYVGRHECIVNLIGACTENIQKREVYLLIEYCENGDMLSYLKSHRGPAFVNYFDRDQVSGNPSPGPAAGSSSAAKHFSIVTYQNATTKKLSTRDLVRWSHEIASGMEFLSSRNVIHGDLAARNVLLAKALVAKVSDFGLSRHLDNYQVYVRKIECPLPLRWMAVESLQDLEFSKESDVWSYGITLWEIFSLGLAPYPGVEWDFESWRLIKDGFRMSKPDYATDDIYNVMRNCWNLEPSGRPSFTELKHIFQVLSIQIDPDCQQFEFTRNKYPNSTSK